MAGTPENLHVALRPDAPREQRVATMPSAHQRPAHADDKDQAGEADPGEQAGRHRPVRGHRHYRTDNRQVLPGAATALPLAEEGVAQQPDAPGIDDADADCDENGAQDSQGNRSQQRRHQDAEIAQLAAQPHAAPKPIMIRWSHSTRFILFLSPFEVRLSLNVFGFFRGFAGDRRC